ncbi:MAG TPA: Rpn family recombination-promoting nuclease/putative transposase [Oscillatoriaceae cyanobacterium M33_DOE_052]|uniref:Transposase n=1 Tax=Planktothricoides sp. SpSt-374 TaxID=2282167 RepID=A0A7C3VE66_9CYAN|nr:Rpn family recombination-promoting nuclease/putative transposase [Oscillatoriaceae cyanobacterium M33_DOE_052]
MTNKADIGSKRLISLEPEKWVKWLTAFTDVEVREIVNSEFQWISRESDVLIRAYTPEYGEFLLINELQLYYSGKLPRRIRAYAGLAEEKYQLPVYPVLVNILQSSSANIPQSYFSEFAGLQARQDYRVINLWEVNAEIVFERSLTALLPFVPVLKGGGAESTVQQALRLLRDDEKLSDLETLLAFFATFVLESSVVQQIMRWDMAVLQQSPWYQEILNQGIQQGREEGREEGLISAIALGLELKFGETALSLMPAVSQIKNVARLTALKDAIKTVNSLAEFQRMI